MPSFTFGVGEKRITIDPKQYIVYPMDSNETWRWSSMQCGAEGSGAYFGAAAMEGFFCHDWGGNRLGT